MALLICAVCVLPVTVTPRINNEWIAILLIGVAAAAHQGFSANLFALSGDLFPRRAVGSVVGIGGMCGAIGGMIFQASAGLIVDHFHSYLPLVCRGGVGLPAGDFDFIQPLVAAPGTGEIRRSGDILLYDENHNENPNRRGSDIAISA